MSMMTDVSETRIGTTLCSSIQARVATSTVLLSAVVIAGVGFGASAQLERAQFVVLKRPPRPPHST